MEWLINLGYAGLFIGTFIAGTVLPLSSDALLLGLLAAGGNVWICLITASLGNWAGSVLSYAIGWMGKWEWLEKFFKVKREKLEKQKKIIDKYGVWIALFPWIPIVGTLSVIALGFYKVKPKTTVLLLMIGCTLRFLVEILLYLKYIDRFWEWIGSF